MERRYGMGSVLWWSIVLVGLLLAGFVVVAQLKKRLMKPDDTISAGFTLSDLRALRRAGKMTEAEFEKAKEAVVAAARRAAEEEARRKSEARSSPRKPFS